MKRKEPETVTEVTVKLTFVAPNEGLSACSRDDISNRIKDLLYADDVHIIECKHFYKD